MGVTPLRVLWLPAYRHAGVTPKLGVQAAETSPVDALGPPWFKLAAEAGVCCL